MRIVAKMKAGPTDRDSVSHHGAKRWTRPMTGIVVVERSRRCEAMDAPDDGSIPIVVVDGTRTLVHAEK